MSKEIPISEAKTIAEKYGYERVIIMAESQSKEKENWTDGWTTTFNKDKTKCKFLGKVAKILHYNFKHFYGDLKTTDEYYNKIKEERV